MKVQELMDQAREVMTVKRVFGEPYEKDGLTIIPVARVMGGGGGGEGRMVAPEGAAAETGEGQGAAVPAGSGSGAGFGMAARPAGVYVIKEGDVRWLPAVDVNRIVLGAQIVAVVFLLVVRSIARARATAGRA